MGWWAELVIQFVQYSFYLIGCWFIARARYNVFFNNHVYGAVVVWFTPGLRRCSYNSDRSMRTSPDFRACVQHVSSLGFKTLLGQWEYHLLAMSHQLSWDVDAGSNDVAKLHISHMQTSGNMLELIQMLSALHRSERWANANGWPV